MSKDTFSNWEEFINPEKLKLALVQSSIYLSSYELFKENIISQVKGFFTFHWELNEETGELEGKPSDDYKLKVINLYPKDEFHACCLWFKNLEALNDDDLMDISVVRKHRNLIAHELPKFLGGQGKFVNIENLNTILRIQRKLDIWWVREIELPTNPDFTPEMVDNINWDEVLGGNTIILNLLSSIFNGDESYLKELHKEFIKVWQKTV